jgi:hypothetical protein
LGFLPALSRSGLASLRDRRSAQVGHTKNTEGIFEGIIEGIIEGIQPKNQKQRSEGYIPEKSSNACVIEGREGHTWCAESLGIPARLRLY